MTDEQIAEAFIGDELETPDPPTDPDDIEADAADEVDD